MRQSQARPGIQAMFETLFARAAVGAILVSGEKPLRVLAGNETAAEMLAYRSEELAGLELARLVHPEDLDTLLAGCRSLEAAVAERFTHEQRCLRRDGSTFWARVSGSLIEQAGTKAAMLLLDDIQKQREIEEAVRQSERRFRLLAENATDMICRHDQDGTFAYVSPAARHILGYEPEELIGRSPYEFFHPDDEPLLRQAHQTLLNSEQRVTVEYRFRRKDGRYIWFETITRRVPSPEDETRLELQSASRDVTSRRLAQDQARQAQEEMARMARIHTLGEMAAGLAHELNQPLAAIGNYAEGCLNHLTSTGSTEKLPEALREISRQAERAGKIIWHIRSMAQKHEPDHGPASLAAVVRDVILATGDENQRRGVEVEMDLPNDLPEVRVDSVQLEQVVLNLVRNATEAMEDVPREQRRLAIAARAEADHTVRLTLHDRGPGMDEAEFERMFHPFYTNKAGGMGIGLNICQSIVEVHGGELWGEHNAAGGMSFHLRLPIADDENDDAV